MSPELMFWFALATKMVVTALFVSVATIVAERLGATVGALVATLPVSAGPVYVFLAPSSGRCVYRKLRLGCSGDAVHRGEHVT